MTRWNRSGIFKFFNFWRKVSIVIEMKCIYFSCSSIPSVTQHQPTIPNFINSPIINQQAAHQLNPQQQYQMQMQQYYMQMQQWQYAMATGQWPYQQK